MNIKFKEKADPLKCGEILNNYNIRKLTKYQKQYTKQMLIIYQKEYPEYKFIQTGIVYRWSSPKIEKMIKEYKELCKKFIKLKRQDIVDYYEYNSYIYPITAHASPIISEKDTKDELDEAKEKLNQLVRNSP